MADIIRVYRQTVGDMLFIGRKYGEADRANGSFGAKWSLWFQNGWFDVIERQVTASREGMGEDSDAYLGMMRENANGDFEYWIGCFVPKNTAIPEGFEGVQWPACDIGVCWVYGKEPDVYKFEGECGKRLEKEGYKIPYTWCFERYTCPRFTSPDDKGNIILDICFVVDKEQ